MSTVVWVDAFAEKPFAGNPAAVCLLESPAEEQWMQALAFEFGLSETAFVWPLGGGVWSLRWFTPAVEVDMCGHATLAAAHAIGGAPGSTIEFSTRSGRLSAHLDDDGIELDFPVVGSTPIDLPQGLGWLGARSAHESSFFMMAELADAREVAAVRPDLGAIAALEAQALIVTGPGGPDGADYVLRVFGPNVGIDEDPVTGSAQCLLAPFWAPRLGKETFVVHQLSARTGRLGVRLRGDRVQIAGRAVTVMKGTV